MDYEFVRDDHGALTARLSMGHEAFGAWLSEEVGRDRELLTSLLAEIEALQAKHQETFSLHGQGYHLYLDAEEVEIMDKSLGFQFAEELEPDMAYYDDELIAGCGLEDFRHLLAAWWAFLDESEG